MRRQQKPNPLIILNKDWIFDPEILEICGHVSREEYAQREAPIIERLNSENQNITEFRIKISMLTHEDRKNVKLIKKKLMTEK